jgi:hypothetical protein
MVLALAMLAMAPTPAMGQTASPVAGSNALAGAVDWLLTQQADDGGFIGFTGESDPGFTLDAVLALVAADHAGVGSGDAVDRAIAYIGAEDHALVYAQTGVGQSAKLILGLEAAGIEPEGFANVMPLSIIEQGQNTETGVYGTGIYDHAYALLALAVMDAEIPESAFDALANAQADNGGWAFDGSADPTMVDSNTTSMVIQALVASGHGDDQMVSDGFTFLTGIVTEAGAPYSPVSGTPVDANSTALVTQAYLAVGEDATGLQLALATFQNPSGGLFYMADDPTDNAFATAQAIPAMGGQVFPIDPVAPAATPVALHDLVAA